MRTSVYTCSLASFPAGVVEHVHTEHHHLPELVTANMVLLNNDLSYIRIESTIFFHSCVCSFHLLTLSLVLSFSFAFLLNFSTFVFHPFLKISHWNLFLVRSQFVSEFPAESHLFFSSNHPAWTPLEIRSRCSFISFPWRTPNQRKSQQLVWTEQVSRPEHFFYFTF